MALDSSTLLIVEDNPADMTHYLRLLEDVDHEFDNIECVSTIHEASNILNNESTLACCLLDFNLPDGSAINLLETYYSNQKMANCPIIVITGQEDTKNAVRLLKLGVQDYLIKDELTSNTLIRTINSAIQNWKLKKQLEEMALFDSLTGLTSRGLFVEKLKQCFNESIRYCHCFALVLIDLDKFKFINDTYGHEAGDFLLNTIGQRIKDTVRKTDIAGRIGGDEFAIILPETDDQSARLVVQKLLKALTIDVVWRHSVIPITTSIGLTVYPSKATNYKELMRQADIALYRAKDRGRSQYVAYNECDKHIEDETELLIDLLPKALMEGKLQVAFQAIVSAQDNQHIYALEALTRWNHKGIWIEPEETIHLVIELGLEVEFHNWLFNSALSTLKEFKTAQPHLKLCINLPANVCHNPQFPELIKNLCASYQIKPSDIILEVSEDHLTAHPEKARECLLQLANAKFQVAIYGFGTGHSSLEYIADLPCSLLKIDKKFLINFDKNERYKKIIEAISRLAHGFDMQVIAEGIENKSILETALNLRCDYLQGFHIGYPVIPSSDWENFLIASKKTPV